MADKHDGLVLALGRRSEFIHVDEGDLLARHRAWDLEEIQFFDIRGVELVPGSGSADPGAELGDPDRAGFRPVEAALPADPAAVAVRLEAALAVARDRCRSLPLPGDPRWPDPGLPLAETMVAIWDPRPEGDDPPTHADGFWHNLWHALWG